MEFKEFKEQIKSLGVVYSIRDKVPYKICSVKDDILTIQRESTENYVDINLKELYDYYKKENRYNTKIARKYISVYAYSPAAAIINAIIESQQ